MISNNYCLSVICVILLQAPLAGLASTDAKYPNIPLYENLYPDVCVIPPPGDDRRCLSHGEVFLGEPYRPVVMPTGGSRDGFWFVAAPGLVAPGVLVGWWLWRRGSGGT